MRSPLTGLFYYHWLRSRSTVAGIAACCIAATFLIRTGAWLFARTPEHLAMAAGLNLLFSGYMTAGLASCMIVWYLDGQLVSLNPGGYLLNMPARTSLVASSFFVYTALVVALLSGCETILHFFCFGDKVTFGMLDAIPLIGFDKTLTFGSPGHEQFTLWMFPVYCIIGVTSLQAFWLLAGLRNEVVQGLGAICLAVVGGGGILLSISENYRHLGMVLCATALPVAYGISHAGVAGFRCQRKESIVPWLLDTFSIRSFRTRPFKSAESALLWYSWRKRFRIVLVGTVCCMPFGFLPQLPALFYGHQAVTEPLPNFFFLVIAAAAVGWSLYTVARDYVESLRGSPFLFVYPVRSVRLAHGVLLPLAGTLALMLVCAFPVAFALSHFVFPLTGRWETTLGGTFTVAAGCGVGSWICMWYAIPFFYVALLLVAGMALGHFVFGMNDPAPVPLILVLVAVILLYGAVSLLIANRNRRIERKNVAFMAIAWGIGVFTAVLLLNGILAMHKSAVVAASAFHPANAALPAHVVALMAMLLFAATLLVPLPFVDLPAVIDYYRHR